MNPITSLDIESQRTLRRILPRLERLFAERIAVDSQGWQTFTQRLAARFPALFRLYIELYGSRYDFFFHIEDLLTSLAYAWFERPADLRELDQVREKDPHWYQSNQMLGGVCYVDLFADNLEGIRSQIPYFKELGLTYLHLMPIFKFPENENDGGSTVSSYRDIHPPFGTMQQLELLTHDLRASGISLVVDLVLSHTSKEHLWAKRAQSGDPDFENFYFIFPDRATPDAYQRTLREMLPDEHAGAFTYFPEVRGGQGGWVWTTFHSYQWDLNYSNPAVFNRMAEEMLFLANQGVEIVRLDAAAFIWKQMGTSCENLPGAHTLIRAFSAVARIASPALLFNSEAAVHPDEMAHYIDPQECQLSYNPLLMALLWNTLATREVNLLQQALETRARIDADCAWVNYVRASEEISWIFSDGDAAQLGVKGGDHRHFLNEFYCGRFPGSFARGLPSRENPKTGDCHISGTCASLAGLEKALSEGGSEDVEFAIRRILLIHGVIMTTGGVPLLYLGDEVATLNDYSYREIPSKAHDSRWVHRSRADWKRYARRHDPKTVEGQVYQGLQQLIAFRKANPIFSGGQIETAWTENDHVLGYIRTYMGKRILFFANFSEHKQTVLARVLEQYGFSSAKRLHGLSKLQKGENLLLVPYDFFVLG